MPHSRIGRVRKWRRHPLSDYCRNNYPKLDTVELEKILVREKIEQNSPSVGLENC